MTSGILGMWMGDNQDDRLRWSQAAMNQVIEDIGVIIGYAANDLVEGKLEPVMDAPSLDPDLVWKISTAYWHEIVHRGLQLGRAESFWLRGISEFSYDEVLVFAQHIWRAFKEVTGLDFTIPEESEKLKNWLSISPRGTQREYADDIPKAPMDERRERLQHYIVHGGPSRKLMEERGEIEKEQGPAKSSLGYSPATDDIPPGYPEATDVTFGSGHVGVPGDRDD